MIQKVFSYPLLLAFLFFSAHLTAANFEDNDELSLYALSSLNCHIKQKLAKKSSSNHDSIPFTDADVALLWHRAYNSSQANIVRKAERCYQKSLELPNEIDSHILLDKAKRLIDKAWKKLNPHISSVLAKGSENQHFLLPGDHWLKSRLDSVFYQWNFIQNQQLFEKAGFVTLCKRTSSMIVAKHHKIPGYLVKIYLQSDKEKQTWKWMINRCLGAENIRNLIKAKKLRYFTVPDKWIYVLPNSEINTEDLLISADETAPGLLVATHVDIVDLEASKRAWKTVVTRRHLRELYCILSHGFASCYLPQNIPYTKQKKFSCLDTEYPHRQHRLQCIGSKLSDEMRAYWEHLVRTGGIG